MGWLSQNMTLIFQFLPGFLTAAIFYTLTTHPKTAEFERVIQALIFTMLLKVVLLPIRSILVVFGACCFSVGKWTSDTDLTWMTILAVPLGVGVAWFANNDKWHEWARARGLTSRTSFPSEWYGAFIRGGQNRWIILHMKEGRRLYGWPEEWPDQADKGHFVVDQPEWVMDDGSRIPIHQANRFLIPVSEVERVEFLSFVHELPDAKEIEKAQAPLIELHRSQKDGSKATESGPKPAEQSITTDGQG
jgi:Family of unknown function (DUF6338)